MIKLLSLSCLLWLSFLLKANPNDSLKYEKINGKNYLLYLVGKEDKIEKLSKQFRVDEKEILLINKRDRFKRNDTILIPMYWKDSADLVQEKAKLNNDSLVNLAHANAQSVEVSTVLTHFVLPGETLPYIAKKYKLNSNQIVKWNNLRSNKIMAGQTLIVHENGAIKPYVVLNSSQAQLPTTEYKVTLDAAKIVVDTGNVLVEEQGVVLHPTLPVGSLVKIINCKNNKQCFVKITGVLSDEKYKNFMMVIDLANQQKLEADSPIFKVRVEYLMP